MTDDYVEAALELRRRTERRFDFQREIEASR